MKLDVAVNEVVLSNVGTTGEFRIRNSAKAFKILSDGLYSNKIRAIIRELSCNAVDSHVGAGKADVPFEVHLPTQFEPWFAVRDFGLGLDGNQVVNIYTTYFESTKTDSNEFIGALGLGSKSPFSYTENFTVTAIKNGTRRIYSAFINEVGVPSIAEMSEELTDEGNGVEVKFSVTDRYDYNSFRHESQEVFQWFKLQPIITGVDNFEVHPEVFKERDIVPGVHAREHNYHSVAIMGNIAYPLGKIPEPRKHFGELENLLGCGLALEFGIGELDFAASREELSYVPITLKSIKKKLELLNANLAIHLAAKANEIENLWLRAAYLQQRAHENLYKAAVAKYVADTKFPLYDPSAYYGRKSFKFTEAVLTARGFDIKAFASRHGSSYKTGEGSDYVNGGGYIKYTEIAVESDVVFVFNDLKTGCVARARYHFNNSGGNATVFCVSHNGATAEDKRAAFDALMLELHTPPTIIDASTLTKREKAKPTSTQGIMKMGLKARERRGYSASYTFHPADFVIDENVTYYYVLLNNYDPVDKEGQPFPIHNLKALMDECGIPALANVEIYGVRKSRAAEIAELDNWVWVEEKIREETAKVGDKQIIGLVASEMLDHYSTRIYTNANVAKMVDSTSDYAKYMAKYGSVKRTNGNVSQLVTLCGQYGKAVTVDRIKKEINDTKAALYAKYPLLKHLHQADEKEVAEYIKLIDKQ